MTRAEIRIIIKGYKTASLFQNSDCNLDFMREILKKIPKETNYSEQISTISKELDCNPVLNTSYIYEVHLEERILKMYDVDVYKKRNKKMPQEDTLVWRKTKLLKKENY